jgi:hypothetical protein
MSEGDSAAVEWIIANTINKTARGDPDALADRIVADRSQPSEGSRFWKWLEQNRADLLS